MRDLGWLKEFFKNISLEEFQILPYFSNSETVSHSQMWINGKLNRRLLANISLAGKSDTLALWHLVWTQDFHNGVSPSSK